MARIIVIVLAILAGLVALSLALPVSLWRTGRLPAPPLDLVAGGPKVQLSSRIWIDTDAACGTTPTTDPDDCLAIAWLAHQARLEIVGISTSFGNALGDVVMATTKDLVRAMAASRSRLPIWRGASVPLDGSGDQASPASEALRSALMDGPLTILALGPLTNIAAALAGEPGLQRNVVRVIAVMGNRPGHIFHPSEGSGRGVLLGHGPIFRDLNFVSDPAAARRVLETSVPLTLIPYDAARHVVIADHDLDILERSDGAIAWAARRSRA